MPTKVVNGVKFVLKRHIWKCLVCQAVAESRGRHDFKTCPCGNLSVDGGITDSGSVSFRNANAIEDKSIWAPLKK